MEARRGVEQSLLKLGDVDGFGEVVVGARVEGRHEVVAKILRREQEHVRLRPRGLGAEGAAHLDAVHAVHHPAHHEHVGRAAHLQQLPGAQAVFGRDGNVPPSREGGLDELPRDRVVVDDEHP